MGIGHTHQHFKQQNFFATSKNFNLSYGGSLRNKRTGRGRRPLSSKDPLHAVFKIQKSKLRLMSLRTSKSFLLIHLLIKKYSKHFAVKVEQLSIQNDHIHILIRTSRRSQFHHFFRVVAGQIAQRFEKEGLLRATDTPKSTERNGTRLWKHRPFSRVVRGWSAIRIVRNYIQLNEQEARGLIKYQKLRLKGLSSSDWKILWA